MKCLAIRQPWAMLVACGIKDVENRNAMIPPCKRFLIAASVTRDAKDLRDCFDSHGYNLITNYIKKGILPPYEQWPTGAIIGWVDIDRVTHDYVDSPWAANDGIMYVLKNAHLFDTPIYGKNKATPFFYNVEGIDENHLPPSHVVKLR